MSEIHASIESGKIDRAVFIREELKRLDKEYRRISLDSTADPEEIMRLEEETKRLVRELAIRLAKKYQGLSLDSTADPEEIMRVENELGELGCKDGRVIFSLSQMEL